mmetsp:Transcript_67340/g.186633  ORF Transcript_67340/g.186633 Transcript_67340/m.186633 type:complete len:306 (+) Transcript_67340:854-1771(+)
MAFICADVTELLDRLAQRGIFALQRRRQNAAARPQVVAGEGRWHPHGAGRGGARCRGRRGCRGRSLRCAVPVRVLPTSCWIRAANPASGELSNATSDEVGGPASLALQRRDALAERPVLARGLSVNLQLADLGLNVDCRLADLCLCFSKDLVDLGLQLAAQLLEPGLGRASLHCRLGLHFSAELLAQAADLFRQLHSKFCVKLADAASQSAAEGRGGSANALIPLQGRELCRERALRSGGSARCAGFRLLPRGSELLWPCGHTGRRARRRDCGNGGQGGHRGRRLLARGLERLEARQQRPSVHLV